MLRLTNPKDFVICRDRADYGMFPATYYYPGYLSERTKEIYGAKLKVGFQTLKGSFPDGTERAILGYAEDYRNLKRSIKEKFLKDASFVSNLDKKCKEVASDYRAFLEDVVNSNSSYAAARFRAAHKKLAEYYSEYALWNNLIWLVSADDLYAEVSNILAKTYGLGEKEIQILLTPNRPSYVLAEQEELLAVTSEAIHSNKFEEQPSEVQAILRKHRLRWGYIPWEYMGPSFWTEHDLLDRSFVLRAEKRGGATKESLKLKKDQDDLGKESGISEYHLRLIADIKTVTMMQDDKKDICTFAQFVLHTVIFAWLGPKLGIPPVMCSKYSEEELWAGLNDSKKILDTLEERKRAMTGVVEESGVTLIWGQKAEDIFDFFAEKLSDSDVIKGQGVSRGRVEGRVKILKSGREISAFETGDILVAPMTTPDYVPAMRKAAAIVTDEGGLTSHAAIVSREFKIPCIVGTKIATKILKDGDVVEVDADTGAVKIIKKS